MVLIFPLKSRWGSIFVKTILFVQKTFGHWTSLKIHSVSWIFISFFSRYSLHPLASFAHLNRTVLILRMDSLNLQRLFGISVWHEEHFKFPSVSLQSWHMSWNWRHLYHLGFPAFGPPWQIWHFKSFNIWFNSPVEVVIFHICRAFEFRKIRVRIFF